MAGALITMDVTLERMSYAAYTARQESLLHSDGKPATQPLLDEDDDDDEALWLEAQKKLKLKRFGKETDISSLIPVHAPHYPEV